MTDLPPSAGATGYSRTAADAASANQGLADDAKQTADAIGTAFDRAGESVAKSLARAASDGKVSLADLASAAITAAESFTKSAVSGAGGGLDGLATVLKSVFSGFLGAKADGGPVTAGGAYLVGERGPELFRPASAGDIAPAGSGSAAVVNVTIAGGGAPQLLRSEAQIAAALARAVALGGR